jgi:hypothetical protein
MIPQQIDQALAEHLPRSGVSIAYRFYVLLVAVAMASLPAVYLALVIGAALGEYYYVAHIIPEAMSHAPSTLIPYC